MTEQTSTPELEAAYRGQVFAWRSYPGWNQAAVSDWLYWLILHEMPQGEENITLWSRNDIFVNFQNKTP